jgi:uncharacterized protein YfbU (UPF0304 family)
MLQYGISSCFWRILVTSQQVCHEYNQVADKISSVFPMLNLNKPAFVVFPWNAGNNNRQYELSMGDKDTL